MGIEVYEYTESPEFCSEACHSMEPYTDTYLNPGNNTILKTHRDNDVICADCHNKPGILGAAQTRIDGLGMVVAELTNDYDPEEFKAEMPNEMCAKDGCHDSVDWVIQTVDDEIYHPYTNNGKKSPETSELCTNCHNPRLGGTGLSKGSCTLCHDLTTAELKAHESRTCGKTTCHGEVREGGHQPTRPKEDACLNCHNRKHPEDAKVPYSVVDNYERENIKINLEINNDFCSDCHSTEFDSFQKYSTGSCTDCHSEHKVTTAIHSYPDPDTTECVNCHVEIESQHNPTEISFRDLISTLENDFCSQCHSAVPGTKQVQHYTFEDGKCINCHLNHKELDPPHIKPTVKFEDCTNCHTEIYSDHKPEVVSYQAFPSSEIPIEFCSSCHNTEYTTYTTYSTPETLENYGVCTDCHNEHKTINYPHIPDSPYDDCSECHTTYDNLTIHNPTDIFYSSFSNTIENEFCSNCHSAQYETYTKYSTPETSEFYGGCTDCHTEHKTVTPPHKTDAPYENCIDCHTNYDDATTTHNPTGIFYSGFQDTIENEFCSNCHNPEFVAYTTNSTPESLDFYGGCTNCHSEHKTKMEPHTTTAPFEVCSNCHTNYDTKITIHNPLNITYSQFDVPIQNEFCRNCHGGQYNSLIDTTDVNKKHTKRDCTECHLDHRSLMIDFNNCASCHSVTPPSHDEKLTGCSDCHDVDKFIHSLG